MESVLKFRPDNFVPIVRTPWGGNAIAEIKSRYLNEVIEVPPRIGESWEVSTDSQFPSQIFERNSKEAVSLVDFLQQAPSQLLGESIASRFGAHIPLLLKWLEANDVLSVQVHPHNSSSLLSNDECGKPESWLVLSAQKDAYVYLGFKEELSREQILAHLRSDEPEKCLHKVFPKPLDYISVPTGVVHAVGPGLLVAEPQYVLPKKHGKTWRLSDWGRRYDDKGNVSLNGKPRELHFDTAAQAIDWSQPRGRELEKLLIRTLSNGEAFLGNNLNPFSVQVFSDVGEFKYHHLVRNSFSLFTIWSGMAHLEANGKFTTCVGGESALVAANASEVKITLLECQGERPNCAFFSILQEAL